MFKFLCCQAAFSAVFLVSFSAEAQVSTNKVSQDQVQESHADSDATIKPIYISEEKKSSAQKLDENARVGGDTLKLLGMNPAVQFQTGGGISSLPVMNGVASDRVNVKLDGASVAASCPNHMNPATSYISSQKVETIEAIAGIVPVSQGGDSLGGSIIVKSKTPDFAKNSPEFKANAASAYGSNNDYFSASVNMSYSEKKNSVSYSGVDEKAENYKNGEDDRINGTLYKQNNHTLGYARKLDTGVLSFKFTHSEVPEQGFVNQYMDLLENTSQRYNLNYLGMIGNLESDITIAHQYVDHYMNKIKSVRAGNMPMFTESKETSVNAKVMLPKSGDTKIQVGTEIVLYSMDDWWPSAGMGSMAPNSFLNINDGQRNRYGFFVEVDTQWTSSYSTQLGLRTDIVKMSTGEVHGYNDGIGYPPNLPVDAAYFNSLDREHTDNNYDLTFVNDWRMSETQRVSLGFARKLVRLIYMNATLGQGLQTSPAASGPVRMDMRMINWFGDGNGYVGDVNLKSEVAHTVSATYQYKVSDNNYFAITPYFSDVKDFIDADLLATSGGVNYLQFANHDALLMGANLSFGASVYNSEVVGDIGLIGIASYSRGYRKDGKDLYHQMPLNGKLALRHNKGNWNNEIEVQMVSKKEDVSSLRLESKTDAYALADISTGYLFAKKIAINFRVSNVFDTMYDLPLGGVDIVNGNDNVSGQGRSYQIGMSYDLF